MNVLGNFYRRFVKGLLVSAACLVMLLSAAYPAMAFGSSPSSSDKGVPEMNEMKETSKKAVRGEPRSSKEVQEKAKRGPNAVQQGANLEKMNNPATSQGAETIEGQAEDLLESITP